MDLVQINPNDLNNHAVKIATQGQLIRFTKGQSGLLSYLRKCVENKTPLSWDMIVRCYYDNVCKTASDYKMIGDTYENRQREWYRYDIWECYQKQDSHWKYSIRGRVKQWFVSTIGILVIKNQLIILPVINIEE